MEKIIFEKLNQQDRIEYKIDKHHLDTRYAGGASESGLIVFIFGLVAAIFFKTMNQDISTIFMMIKVCAIYSVATIIVDLVIWSIGSVKEKKLEKEYTHRVLEVKKCR